jgi:hypothetical protein
LDRSNYSQSGKDLIHVKRVLKALDKRRPKRIARKQAIAERRHFLGEEMLAAGKPAARCSPIFALPA